MGVVAVVVISNTSDGITTHYCKLVVKSTSEGFSALMLLVGRQEGIWPEKTERWGAGMVICLERGANLHMAQPMPLPFIFSCFSKIQIGLPFWYPLTWVVPEKGPLNGSVSASEILKIRHLAKLWAKIQQRLSDLH